MSSILHLIKTHIVDWLCMQVSFEDLVSLEVQYVHFASLGAQNKKFLIRDQATCRIGPQDSRNSTP